VADYHVVSSRRVVALRRYRLRLSVADLERTEPAPPPLRWATDRRRHGTPDKWKRSCIMASVTFWSFYCKL